MRYRFTFVIAAVLTSVAPTSVAAQSMPTDSLAHARKMTEWFFTAQHDSVLAWMNVESKADVSRADLQERLEGLVGRVGLESEVIEEKFVKRNGMTQYWRTSKYSDYDEPVLFRWAFNKQGQIAGMGLGPASQAPPIDPD